MVEGFLFCPDTKERGEASEDKERSEICEVLKEKFGEKNPDVKV